MKHYSKKEINQNKGDQIHFTWHLTQNTQHNSPKSTHPPQREKRFVAAAALVTGILGTFMGLYNTIEINKIQTDLKDLQQGQKLLIEFTKTMEHQISRGCPPTGCMINLKRS